MLTNGQAELTYSKAFNIDIRPTQLGAFVLSYARQRMNWYYYQVGIQHVAYGDTDSLYIPKSIFTSSGLVTSNDLGGIKNDYSDGSEISFAIFAGWKNYFCRFQDLVVESSEGEIVRVPRISYKCAGIQFCSNNVLSNFGIEGTLATLKLDPLRS